MRYGSNVERSRWRFGRAMAAIPFVIAACGGGPEPVAPEVMAAEEQRLLAPFQTRRTVIGDQVEVVVSPNFIGSRVDPGDLESRVATGEGMSSLAMNRVALPGIDKNLHDRREAQTNDGLEITFINRLGGIERPILMLVGQTEYRALQGLTVRIPRSGARMTLDVTARGEVTVLAGAERLDVSEFVIRDGLWLGQ